MTSLNETSLELVQEAEQDFKLTFSFSGSLHQIRVNWKDTVLNVKHKIEAYWQVSSYVQFLRTERRWLRDDQTLRDVLMFLDRPLELHIIFGKGFQMFVKVLTGRTLTFEMESTDLVDELKCKLEQRDGVPKASAQNLIFAGKQLQCGYMLADYGVGCTPPSISRCQADVVAVAAARTTTWKANLQKGRVGVLETLQTSRPFLGELAAAETALLCWAKPTK